MIALCKNFVLKPVLFDCIGKTEHPLHNREQTFLNGRQNC